MAPRAHEHSRLVLNLVEAPAIDSLDRDAHTLPGSPELLKDGKWNIDELVARFPESRPLLLCDTDHLEWQIPNLDLFSDHLTPVEEFIGDANSNEGYESLVLVVRFIDIAAGFSLTVSILIMLGETPRM
jgi:hypothetical protein